MSRHLTKYTVKYLSTGMVLEFDNLEDAKSHCLMYGGNTPIKLEYPIYGF